MQKNSRKQIGQVSSAGPFQATWESLEDYRAPKWYKDAKFGIFVHWGAYSVPAFGNEWYPRNMYGRGSAAFKYHLKTYGSQAQCGYKLNITRVELLGSKAQLTWKRDAKGLMIELPARKPCDHAFAFKIVVRE